MDSDYNEASELFTMIQIWEQSRIETNLFYSNNIRGKKGEISEVDYQRFVDTWVVKNEYVLDLQESIKNSIERLYRSALQETMTLDEKIQESRTKQRKYEYWFSKWPELVPNSMKS